MQRLDRIRLFGQRLEESSINFYRLIVPWVWSLFTVECLSAKPPCPPCAFEDMIPCRNKSLKSCVYFFSAYANLNLIPTWFIRGIAKAIGSCSVR